MAREMERTVPAGVWPMDERAAVVVQLGPGGPAVVPPRQPFLRADDVGVLRGDGVFEHFLVRAGQPRHLDEHLARLARSAVMTDLVVPGEAAWRAAVQAAIGAWTGPEEWAVRLVSTRGPEDGGPPTSYVHGHELDPAVLRHRRQGLAVVTVERGPVLGAAAAGTPWLLLGAKTLSYAVNMAVKRWALAQGADDAIFVGADGEVFEAGTSAVVAAFGRRLVSPPPSIGILDSITVARLAPAAVAAGWAVERRRFHVADLFAADGLWLSSSLRFARVHTLDGKALPLAPAHEELTTLANAS